jgi:hypothetical protein
MKGCQLPIGVVMPTLNVRPQLPAHLAQMRTWADLVEEIVVVDSYSTDGTLELLQAEFSHARLRILQHPRGLYQSWNHAIQHVTAKYTYVSTIGDTITADGLEHLAATAEDLQSEVVISRPELFDAAGQPLTGRRWPIHKFLDACPLDRPMRLEPRHVFLVATVDVPEGMLGSSASNLYRTDSLKRFPFPTEYGHAGDTAWGVRYGWQVSLAATPSIFSRFVVQPAASEMTREAYEQLMDRFHELVGRSLHDFLEQDRSAAALKILPVVLDISTAKLELNKRQRCYYAARSEFWPWFINPRAWKARAQRNQQREQLFHIREKIRQASHLTSALASSGPRRSAPLSPEVSEHLACRILAGYP